MVLNPPCQQSTSGTSPGNQTVDRALDRSRKFAGTAVSDAVGKLFCVRNPRVLGLVLYVSLDALKDRSFYRICCSKPKVLGST